MSDQATVVGDQAAFVFPGVDVFGFMDDLPMIEGSTGGVPQPTGTDAAAAAMDTASAAAASMMARNPSNHPLFWSAVLIALGWLGLAVAASLGQE